MRITVQPVDIPELIKAMKLIINFVDQNKKPISVEDLQNEFLKEGYKKGIAKIRNIIWTLDEWGLINSVERSKYEPSSKYKKFFSLPNKRIEMEIKKIILKNEPKFLEMLYLLEGSRLTVEELSNMLGTTIVTTNVFLRWGLHFKEIEKRENFFTKRPTKDDITLPHKQLARCVASELARVGFNISFEQGKPPIDLIAESQDKQRKIYVECKSSIGEVNKGIGQLVVSGRKKTDELWLVLPTSVISEITYNRLFKILEGLSSIRMDLVLYDLDKFLNGEAAFRERIRLFGRRWKADQDFLQKLIDADFKHDFDEEIVAESLQIERIKAKKILNRLVYRGLLLKRNGKYSFRFKNIKSKSP